MRWARDGECWKSWRGQRFLQQFSGRGEKQSVRVAYREEFREGVRLRAWMAGSVRAAAASVIYLPEQSIRASVAAAKAVYKPGETATLRFAVQDETGKGVPAAIGLAVVDEAVGQRWESMERAGLRGYGSPCWYCDEQALAEIAGESLESLSERARKGALPEDLNLVAELLLWLKTQDDRQDRHEEEDDGAPTWRRIQEDSDALQQKIQRQGWEGMRTPRNEEELGRLYAEAGALFLQDPWQNPYRFRFGVEGMRVGLRCGVQGRMGSSTASMMCMARTFPSRTLRITERSWQLAYSGRRFIRRARERSRSCCGGRVWSFEFAGRLGQPLPAGDRGPAREAGN